MLTFAVFGQEDPEAIGAPTGRAAERLPPPRREPAGRSRVGAWTLLGLGVAAAVAGVVAGAMADDIAGRDKPVAGEADSHSLTQTEARRQSNLALGANILFGSGAVLGVGGAIAFAF